ncbi:MAG: hypothetical protein KJO49_13070 [Bacteroidia bacterium]|nr:hypothetical protein [Bacteroidia bacterium]
MTIKSMKNLLSYALILVFLSAFTCENEPLEGEFNIVDPVNDCEDATSTVDIALLAFQSSNADNYEVRCNGLKQAYLLQIDACGDPDGSIQQSINALGDCTQEQMGFNCNGLELSEVAGQGFTCDYNMYDQLSLANVYLEEDYATDEDNDGTDDHFLNRIYITDGTAELDANNVFQTFSVQPTYILEITLFSIGTSGLIADDYKPFINVDPSTESYLSLSVSTFSTEPCEINLFGCDNDSALTSGIVSVTGAPGNFEVCFDLVLDSSGNCIKGIENNLIPIDIP